MTRALTLAEGRRVVVEVPASSANLGAGFDCVGLALGLVNLIELEVCRDCGGAIELVVESPWFVHQPSGEYFDLSLSDDEILRQTEALCRATGDWQPYEEWRAQVAQRIADDQAGLR